MFLFVTANMSNAYAQSVGIGGTPNPNAVLTITSTNQGLLIPRMNELQRTSIANPADGLLVYDAENAGFFLYRSDAGGWQKLAPTPTGMIVMWYGDMNLFEGSIGTGKMEGWAICDGTGSTPDLRGLFIQGYDGSSGLGTDGGKQSQVLTESLMPSHTHSINDPGHIHGASLSFSGHSHNISYHSSEGPVSDYAMAEDGSQYVYSGDGSVSVEGLTTTTTFSTSLSTASAGISLGSTGSAQPIENRPPYYVLLYIQKIDP